MQQLAEQLCWFADDFGKRKTPSGKATISSRPGKSFVVVVVLLGGVTCFASCILVGNW